MNKKFINKSEDHQRFSLRKLSIGVASVLLGTSFMVYGSHTVLADENTDVDNSDKQVVQVDRKATNSVTQDEQATSKSVSADNVETGANAEQKVAESDTEENVEKNVETADKAQKVSQNTTANDQPVAQVDKNITQDANKALDKDVSAAQTIDTNKIQKVSSTDSTNSKADKNTNVTSNTDNSDIDENRTTPITREEAIKLFHLDAKDISADQLAKIGLKPDEYLFDGVKYHVEGKAEIIPFDQTTGKQLDPLYFDMSVIHNADGTIHDSNADIDNLLQVIYNVDANMDVMLKPVLDGGTIYVNKGAALTDVDAKRGVIKAPDLNTQDALSLNWDDGQGHYAIDVNKAGTYDGMFDVKYTQNMAQSGVVNVAVGVKVVVVDLNGKDQYTHIDADIPTAETSVDGAPAGSKIAWANEPSTDKVGDSIGQIVVTYPDGTTGKTTSTLHVIGPDVQKQVEVWQGDPVPEAQTVVNNIDEISAHIPGTTTYTWGNKVSTTTPGDFPTTVITHWPDGKTTTSQTTIVVKKLNEPVTDGEGTTEEVSRDIYTQLDNQEKQKVDTQTVTLHRTGTKNLKTGEITWDAWQEQTVPAYKAPEIKNYNVTNPDAGKAVVADGSTTKLADVVFQYTQGSEVITDGDGTHMEISRDIYTKLENPDAKRIDTETVTLHRTGVKNLVTGEIKWNAWNAQTMPAYNAPEIEDYEVKNPDAGSAVAVDGSQSRLAGYVLENPDAAPAVTVDGSKDKLDDVTFNFKAVDQSVKVNYVDEETKNVITSTSVGGRTGETVDFNANDHVPAGWSIVKNQQIPTSFIFGSEPLRDVDILIHHNDNDRYKVSVPDGGKVVTHVGANENVPSMIASGIQLNWTEDGKTVEKPEGVSVTWDTVPATNEITTETGTLKITYKDGTSTTLTIPVEVQGAIAGDIQVVNQGDAVPAAKGSVNTSSVDHFGITKVDWQTAPSTTVPAAKVPGVARVFYSDGTYQDVFVNIDVREVRHGEDHKNDITLYRQRVRHFQIGLVNGRSYGNIVMVVAKHDEIIDLAIPEGQEGRVIYTPWVTSQTTRTGYLDEDDPA